jgi:quinoprotein glucose dehydrogenase
MHRNKAILAISMFGLCSAATCRAQDATRSDDEEHSPAYTEWLHHRGNPGSQNYSSLDLIDKHNVGELKIAWRWRSDNFGPEIYPNLQTTPLMVDGVLYATAGARRVVVAIDAATGETLWMYRYDEGKRGDISPRKGPGRGVAFWRAGSDERILFITPGFRLIALNRLSGQPVETFGSGGIVNLKASIDQDLDLEHAIIGSSSPPLVVNDVVIVGSAFPSGRAPTSKSATVGNVSAFDARTGKRLWVFHTIPQPGEVGNNTWLSESWEYTGNVGVWTPMSADADRGLVYLPVEAPTGDVFGGHRPGDNLFSQSLVALDTKTGRRAWHFQTVRHGIWDYDLPAPPVLVDITVDGTNIPAVAQVTKQGFTFVFDRYTGKPVWPIVDQAVPQSDVPGEHTAATQPFPSLPEPFEQQGVDADSLNNLTPEIHAEARRIVRQYRMGPLYTPPTIATDKMFGTLMSPSTSGGANWQGAVADPDSAVLYVSSTSTIGVVGLASDPDRSDMALIGLRRDIDGPFGLPLEAPPWGRITAIDLNTGKRIWMVPNGDTPEAVRNHEKLKGVDIPRTGHGDRVGLLVTKTLLFAGEGSGIYGATGGGTKFRAHDKLTGEIVSTLDLGARQTGVPMTYAVNGQQFIVVAVGATGQAGELVALTVN